MFVKSWLVLWFVGLVAVTTVSADGAWVLWEYSVIRIELSDWNSSSPGTWEPLDAFLTRATCLERMRTVWTQALAESLQVVTAMHDVVRKGSACTQPATVQVHKTPYTDFTLASCVGGFRHTFRCFPETLDPRTRP